MYGITVTRQLFISLEALISIMPPVDNNAYDIALDFDGGLDVSST